MKTTLAIIGIAAALMIATAVIASTPLAFARDVDQSGRCRNCQQNQAVDNRDSLNTVANGGQANSG
jgi:hypothetical protein